MSKHTAGAWRIEGPYSRKGLADQPRVYYWAIEAGADVSGTRVADVYESPKGRADRENANARLIAAAPELLEALTTLVGIVQNTLAGDYDIQGEKQPWLAEAEAAIAKAKGEAG